MPDGTVTLEPADCDRNAEGAGGLGRRRRPRDQVLIDARITPELAREGMAREVVRHVQELRKTADLNIEDRIVLYLGTDGPELRKAIDGPPRLHRRRDADGAMGGVGRAALRTATTVKIEGQSWRLRWRRHEPHFAEERRRRSSAKSG